MYYRWFRRVGEDWCGLLQKREHWVVGSGCVFRPWFLNFCIVDILGQAQNDGGWWDVLCITGWLPPSLASAHWTAVASFPHLPCESKLSPDIAKCSWGEISSVQNCIYSLGLQNCTRGLKYYFVLYELGKSTYKRLQYFIYKVGIITLYIP